MVTIKTDLRMCDTIAEFRLIKQYAGVNDYILGICLINKKLYKILLQNLQHFARATAEEALKCTESCWIEDVEITIPLTCKECGREYED